MTMAPGRRKRGYWLELFFISLLLFLLMGSRTQQNGGTAGVRSDLNNAFQQSLAIHPLTLK